METVEIRTIKFEGYEYCFKEEKDSDFKVWIKIIKSKVNWLRLDEAKTWWSRGRTQWPVKSVKAETVDRKMEGFEYGRSGPYAVVSEVLI